MLAHTTSRHIIIGAQLIIGMALLSASYFTNDNISAESMLKGNHQPVIEELHSEPGKC